AREALHARPRPQVAREIRPRRRRAAPLRRPAGRIVEAHGPRPARPVQNCSPSGWRADRRQPIQARSQRAMLTFTVHEQPNPPADRIDRAERLTFVRDGFSWTAALFAPVWLLAHRLWWPFLGYLAAEGVIEFVRQSELLHPGWTTLAAIGISLLIGLEA